MKCCNITAGSLRSVINIQRRQTVDDGIGGTTATWNTIASPRANVKPIGGRQLVGSELLKAMRLEVNINYKIYIRYRTDILTSDRVNYNGRLMQIRSIINIEERNKWLELSCEEGVST